ncbi:chemotaxis protein CheW [Pseudoalteromonas citrea]|nr:chemotaxis protein CheW [Pseudoalteromonas citrea]
MMEMIETDTTHGNNNRYLFVCIGHDNFGIPIDAVKEVIEYTDTTMVPMCSTVIKGVINVRGSVIPVLDIQNRLSLKKNLNYNRYSCIVLYEFIDDVIGETVTLGMLVNSVVSIEYITHEHLESSPSFGSNIPRQYVWKMAKIHNRLTTLLDMSRVLDINEINALLKTSQDKFFVNYCKS